MDLIKRITGKKRKPSTRAQLIALPKAVVIHTDEGDIIVTTKLAKDIQANLPQIIEQAESEKSTKENQK